MCNRLITKGRNGTLKTMSTGSPASHSLRSRSHDALTPTHSLAEFFSDLAGSLFAGYSATKCCSKNFCFTYQCLNAKNIDNHREQAKQNAYMFTQALSTPIKIVLNPQLFLPRYGFCPHTSGKFDSESGYF